MKDEKPTTPQQYAQGLGYYDEHTAEKFDAFTEGFEQAIGLAAQLCEENEVLLPIEAFMGTKKDLGAAVAKELAKLIRELK